MNSPDSSIFRAAHIDRLRSIRSAAKVEAVGNMLSVILATAMLYRLVDAQWLALWTVAILGSLAHRAYLLLTQDVLSTNALYRWYTAYGWNIFANACLWGVLLFTVSLKLDRYLVPYFFMIMGPIIASPSLTYFTDYRLYLRFALPAMVPAVLCLIFQFDPLSFILGLLLLGWIIVTHENSKRVSEETDRLTVLRARKQVLAEQPLRSLSTAEEQLAEQQLQEQRGRLMIEAGISEIGGNVYSVLMICIVYWQQLGPTTLTAWAGICIVLLSHRIWLIHRFKTRREKLSVQRWKQWYRASTTVLGVCWGGLFLYASATLPITQLSILFMMVGGLIAAPGFSYYTDRLLMDCFNFPAVIPTVVYLLSTGLTVKALLGVLSAAWLILIINNAAKLNAQRDELAGLNKQLLRS